LAIGDAEGLEAVSLRRIAGELGVTPMALYRYVPSKDELLDEMLEAV
jgi:AcrR family transcriptional regulator